MQGDFIGNTIHGVLPPPYSSKVNYSCPSWICFLLHVIHLWTPNILILLQCDPGVPAWAPLCLYLTPEASSCLSLPTLCSWQTDFFIHCYVHQQSGEST